MAKRRNLLGGKGAAGGPSPAPPAGGSERDSGDGRVEGGGFGRSGRLKVDPDPERDLACCRLTLTDFGLAERWRLRFGADFRFCPEIGWHAWDGRRWKLLSEEKDHVPAEVIWSIALTVRSIRNEAALVAALGGIEQHRTRTKAQEVELEAWAIEAQDEARDTYLKGDDDAGTRAQWLEDLALKDWAPRDTVIDFGKRKSRSGQLAAWAKAREDSASIGKVVRWVKGFTDIVVRPADFDADRMAINLLNGTLRLQQVNRKRGQEEIEAGKSEWHTVWDVKLHKHDRADLITKLAPVKYSQRATCPVYDAFIARVQPDEAMRRFIHQWGGLSLTGDVSEQKLAFFYGSGRNGKGTWVELIAHIMGDYAGSIPIESFLDNGGKRRGDQATPDIARLPGVRFLRVSEPEKNSSLNEGLIKMVTGGDPVDARHLNKGFFTFWPDFKMTISGNHKPKVKDTSDGIWRRMQLVPWTVTIPESEVDAQLGEKLRAEASGVLNRLIEGLLDWRLHRLIVPDEVRLATRAYRDQSDDLGRFLTAICVVSADTDRVRVGAKFLHELYTAWAEAAGGSTWSLKGFKGAMEDRGFKSIQSDGIKWLGVMPRPGVDLEGVKRGEWPEPDDNSGPDGGPAASGQGGSGAADPPDFEPGDDDVPDWD